MTSVNQKFNISTQKYLKKSSSIKQGSIFEKQQNQKASMLKILREQQSRYELSHTAEDSLQKSSENFTF